ncbi:DUF6328 family protein [Cellulomonas marina]|uniref:Sodium:proton antiporter n=1 Tax=Cellulomonas marina TaxID=988821 RepID=A0A1I0ZWW6_9CELL|nr:DUF6328 family protein [Cellulomonas marina]GIG30551.1 hypothetical protein Cma02nite_31510 [Cellulomonas marina]SFB29566.1 hypothetical protein SAMN05421867_11316 [Cellulomonas marina]
MTHVAPTPADPQAVDAPAAGPRDRDETPTERADRNWNELLQELRVVQTGAQILVGFLLTIPFQSRFADLDTQERTTYLTLLVLATVATTLIVAPVSLHRALFRRGRKPQLVTSADRLARTGLVVLAAVLAGVPLFLFDVVVSRTAGYVVGGAVAVLLLLVWWLLPQVLIQRAERSRPSDPR